MKLVIKAKDIEIEYQDDYSMLEDKPKERIQDILKTILESNNSLNTIVGTVDEIFNMKKKP